MIISMIAAASENNVIGKDNELVWHMPADFQYFKNKTKGHIIIMGRKTFDSLGKPLKYRTNVVVTRNDDFKPEGTEIFKSLKEAIEWSKTQDDSEVFIIGGASIYAQAMNDADRIYLTRIHESFEGDTHFPEMNEEWKLVSQEAHKADEKNPHDFTFMVFEK